MQKVDDGSLGFGGLGGASLPGSAELPCWAMRYRFEELPKHLQWNPYIRKWYRAHLTFRDCLHTLFAWHNDTINVWSHLLGFLWAAAATVDVLLLQAPMVYERTQSFMSVMPLVVYLMGVMFCLLASSAYHLFLPQHTEVVYKRCLMVDLLGITMGMLSCYVPGLYYGFYCHGLLSSFYFTTVVGLIVFNVLMQSRPEFLTQAWDFRRVMTFAITLGFGAVPVAHWAFLNAHDAEELDLMLPKVIACYATMLLGGILYVSKYPECCNPGRFDLIGSSHQLWHVCVVVAYVHWYRSSKTMLHYRLDHTCPAILTAGADGPL